MAVSPMSNLFVTVEIVVVLIPGILHHCLVCHALHSFFFTFILVVRLNLVLFVSCIRIVSNLKK